MPEDLYHHDFVAWSAAQASALRRLRAGERANDVDWENLIEEVQDLGRSHTQAVESYLLRALIHALKVAAWPEHTAARKWRNEIGMFLLGARKRFAPSMRQALDIPDLHRDARRLVLGLDLRRAPRPLPATTDLTLDELLDEAIDLEALIARLGPPD